MSAPFNAPRFPVTTSIADPQISSVPRNLGSRPTGCAVGVEVDSAQKSEIAERHPFEGAAERPLSAEVTVPFDMTTTTTEQRVRDGDEYWRQVERENAEPSLDDWREYCAFAASLDFDDDDDRRAFARFMGGAR